MSRSDYVYIVRYGGESYVGQASTPRRGLNHWLGSHSKGVNGLVNRANMASVWPDLWVLPLVENTLEDLSIIETLVIQVLRNDSKIGGNCLNRNNGRNMFTPVATQTKRPGQNQLFTDWFCPAGPLPKAPWEGEFAGARTNGKPPAAPQGCRVETEISAPFSFASNRDQAILALNSLPKSPAGPQPLPGPPTWQGFFGYIPNNKAPATLPFGGTVSVSGRGAGVVGGPVPKSFVLINISDGDLDGRPGVNGTTTEKDLRERAEKHWSNLEPAALAVSPDAPTHLILTVTTASTGRPPPNRLVIAVWGINGKWSKMNDKWCVPISDVTFQPGHGLIGAMLADVSLGRFGSKWIH